MLQVRVGNDLLQTGEIQSGRNAFPESTWYQPSELSPAVSHWSSKYMALNLGGEKGLGWGGGEEDFSSCEEACSDLVWN